MPLVVAEIGQEMTISKILGDDEMSNNLKQMGIVKGAKVTISSIEKDALMCVVDGKKVVIDKSTAQKILVA